MNNNKIDSNVVITSLWALVNNKSATIEDCKNFFKEYKLTDDIKEKLNKANFLFAILKKQNKNITVRLYIFKKLIEEKLNINIRLEKESLFDSFINQEEIDLENKKGEFYKVLKVLLKHDFDNSTINIENLFSKHSSILLKNVFFILSEDQRIRLAELSLQNNNMTFFEVCLDQVFSLNTFAYLIDKNNQNDATTLLRSYIKKELRDKTYSNSWELEKIQEEHLKEQSEE